ncbi:TIGR02450 family Trp-rich protein [Vibrio sp. E150_011]
MNNKINPKKLLHSKWTALNPINREKHFMVTELEVEEGVVVHCAIEAVMTKRLASIDWRELKDKDSWMLGWK